MSHKMLTFMLFFYLLVIVCAKPDDSNSSESDSGEENCPRYCVGNEYRCKDGYCYCKPGYVPNHTHNRCVRCPGLGQKCYGRCCDTYETNRTLTCWNGICAVCHAQESQNTWICRDPYESVILISSTQIAMGTALILGIIATFVLIYRLCAVTGSRPSGTGTESRLSIGSLQLYVDERLRDAPPRYSRTSPSVPTIMEPPSPFYINAGFVHDSSVPPPPYTPDKNDNSHQNSTIYM